jgi:hypothetical protein
MIMDIVQIQMAALPVNAIRDMLEMGSRVSVNLQTFLDKMYYSNPIAFLSTQSMREYNSH